MAIPPPPEDSNNLSTPLERLLAMEQQKRLKAEQEKQDTNKTASNNSVVSSSRTGRPRESPSREMMRPSVHVPEPSVGDKANRSEALGTDAAAEPCGPCGP